MLPPASPPRRRRPGGVLIVPVLLGLAAMALLVSGPRPRLLASTPVTVGFRDFSYGTTGNSTPTGEKPESKLWWNDGSWWGSLYNDAAQEYHIYRLDLSVQGWVDTGTALDDRNGTKADLLWDGQKLYVVSHVFTTNGAPSSSERTRLYRYGYDPVGRHYGRDNGFPVDITNGKAETVVLAKDSTGKLWVTWVEGSKVMVNHSNGDDATWAAPSVLPASAAAVSVTSDDISSAVAFAGNLIGVMWSNQTAQKTYFAVHRDGDADGTWQPEETAVPGPADPAGAWSDDHINLKSLQSDGSGRVFAAVKTALTADSDPLVLLLVRDLSGIWSSHAFGRVSDDHTRPIVVLDEENGKVYVFATSPATSGTIYYKSTDVNNIQFPAGLGTPFIQSATDTAINNVTSTRQNVNSVTGLVAIASDQNTRYYLHNYLAIPPLSQTIPRIDSFTPASGIVGTQVTITGGVLSGVTAVAFNGTAATSFIVDSDSQIRATVPVGATSGPISVSDGQTTAWSSSSFLVITAPAISSFSPASGPAGTVVTIAGTGFTGVSQVAFNGAAAGFSFVSDTQVQATVPSAATSGPISVTNPAGTAASSASFVVTLPPLTFLPSDDAEVRSSSPDGNFGTTKTLRVAIGSTIYHSYLKFNVSGVAGTVASAKLRLFVSDTSVDAGAVYLVGNDYAGTTTPWVQGGLTYNNAPAIGGTALATIGPVGVKGWIELEVKAAVAGNGVFSFGAASGSTDIVAFNSKEGPHKPQLVVTAVR